MALRYGVIFAVTCARASGRAAGRARRSLSTASAADSFPPDFYFRQITPGQDVALSNEPLAQVSRSMANFYYSVGDKSTGEAFLIDACWVVDEVVSAVQDDNMTIVGSLATHFHYDHIGAASQDFGAGPMRIPGIFELSDLGLPVHVPEQEVEQAAKQTGLEVVDLTPLTDSQCMSVGRFKLEFMHTPGHSPGSMCIRVTGEEGEGGGKVDLLIAGDTIFPGSCGRLDLPGSDPRVMWDSLQKLAKLPSDVPVYPGHGYSGSETTIGREKEGGYLSPNISREQWNAHMAR